MFKKKASRFAVIYTQKIDGNNMKITTDEDLEYFEYLIKRTEK